jgi:hypothetical protein
VSRSRASSSSRPQRDTGCRARICTMFRGRLPTWDLADGSVGVGHERFQAVEDPDSARTGRSDARRNSIALDDRRLPTGGCWLVPANAQVPRGGSEGWNLYRFERPPSRRFTPLLIVSAPRSGSEEWSSRQPAHMSRRGKRSARPLEGLRPRTHRLTRSSPPVHRPARLDETSEATSNQSSRHRRKRRAETRRAKSRRRRRLRTPDPDRLIAAALSRVASRGWCKKCTGRGS